MRKKILKRVIAVCLIALAVIFFVMAVSTGTEIVGKICTSEVNARINDIINSSNDMVMSLEIFYSDYFTPIYGQDGKLVAILANTGLINQITLIWNTEIQNRLNALRMLELRLPIGMLTGSAVLAEYGREMSINAHVVSNCAITYESKLIHSGINQTLHRLILYTEVLSDVSVPIKACNVQVTQEIILAETLLEGDVPNSYLIGEGSCDYLDLIAK